MEPCLGAMPFREFERLSPNRNASPHERLGVVCHHSQRGFAETIEKMLNPESLVSYHCLVDVDGTRCTLVPDTEIAWHAGASRFLGRDRCNDFMLGFAFAGDTYEAPLSPEQIASALEWLGARWRPLGWDADRITDHRQVAPGRKQDLNPVEWKRLAEAVSGHFGSAAP
ncbi:MAG TPA: N-acetylmuramoyl-L-alanine amidase [Opitutaceae bacterium]